jgi:hypothetical protein
MYSIGQIRSWPLPHLKTGGWYIDCGKGFYPEEEEELKAAVDAKDSASGFAPTTEEADKGQDDAAELVNMSEKERKKEIARRVLEIEKEKKNKKKEEEQAKEKANKASVKAGKKPAGSSRKSKDADAAKSAGGEVPETNPTTVSSGLLKRNATFAGLSMSRLQLGTTGTMKDSVPDLLLVQEFFFHGSFLTVEAHYGLHNVYSKEWLELMAFLEKVTTPSLAQLLTLEFDQGVIFLPLFSSKSLLLRLLPLGDEHLIRQYSLS